MKYYLASEIGANGTLKLGGTLTQHMGQILQVIAGGDAEFADKVLRSRLEIAVVFFNFLLWSPKVGIGRNRRRAFEPLQSSLGFGLSIGVERSLAEVLVR